MGQLSGDEIRAIHEALIKAASILGTFFCDPTKTIEGIVSGCSLEQIMAETSLKNATFGNSHATYIFDRTLSNVATGILTKTINEIGLDTALRIEHGLDNLGNTEVSVINPNAHYVVHANPLDGTKNYMDALYLWAVAKRAHIDVPIIPQACITLAFCERDNPYNPIVSAIYSFSNKTVYSAYNHEGGDPDRYTGTRGVSSQVLLPHKVAPHSNNLLF
ncbi:hypothetical protein JXC34_04390, partial [Candidatus Woesearchaeota archaeon]|nr:hypothetical protein [Candidatus Woesearchaeota archaeon]